MEAYTALAIPSNDTTTIHLRGNFRWCTIVNIYNDCTNNDMVHSLSNYLNTHAHIITPETTNHMFWCGDFNHHHPLWEEEYNKHLFSSPNMINLFIDLIIKYNMLIILPLGIQTYKTTTGNWTWLDNVWHNDIPNNPVTICDVDPSLCPPLANHLPIHMVLNLPVSRAHTPP